MRRSIFFCLLAASAITGLKAQDVITRKDGSTVKTKIIEIRANDVTYKLFEAPSGQTHVLSKSLIRNIVYENGKNETFENNVQPNTSVRSDASRTQPAQRREFASHSQLDSRQQSAPGNTPVYRRNYIGMGVGGAFSLESDGEAGGQFSLHFGYLFTRKVGIAVSYIYTVFEYDYGNSGLLIGPLFSFGPTSGNFAFDIKPAVGYAQSVDPTSWNFYSHSYSGIALGLGTSLRWGCGRYISISGNNDLYAGPGNISYGFSLGINVRLK